MTAMNHVFRRNLRPPAATVLAGALGLVWTTLACAPKYEPPSQVDSLRILAVQKDRPYAKPGEEVKLQMLWTDGAAKAEETNRKVTITWLAWCLNPPGDLYYACFAQPGLVSTMDLALTQLQAGQALQGSWPAIAQGDTFSVRIPAEGTSLLSLLSGFTGTPNPSDGEGAAGVPSEIPGAGEVDLSSLLNATFELRQPPEPSKPAYGLAYIYFAACAGVLGLDPEAVERFQSGSPTPASQASPEIPLRCFDPTTGEALGAEDFVFGYTSVYVYRTLTNANPAITGFQFGGNQYSPAFTGESAVPLGTSCADGDCVVTRECKERTSETDKCGADSDCCSGRCLDGNCEAPDCTSGLFPCVPHCTSSDSKDCPTYEFRPIVAKDLAEPDPISGAAGQSVSEQMWITYSVQKGEVSNDLRLLNDSTTGYNDDFAAEFTAPKEPGWSQIWAAARDNRGGVGWYRQRVFIE